MKVLLAGATGAIGAATRAALTTKGYELRCLSRRATACGDDLPGGSDVFVGDAMRAATLDGAAEGCAIVVSALGASVDLDLRGRASYGVVDVTANLNLLDEAQRAGVERFVYVGVHAAPGYAHTRYVRAHEVVHERLAQSPLSTTTIRPVGVFTAMEVLLKMARRGAAQVMGDGSATTNPIHQADVADNVVANLENGPSSISIGGPDVLSRREIAELAFAALGKTPHIKTTPPGLIRATTPLVRLFHPRIGDLLEFAVEVSTRDCVAPVAGHRRLRDYFVARAKPPPEQLPAGT